MDPWGALAVTFFIVECDPFIEIMKFLWCQIAVYDFQQLWRDVCVMQFSYKVQTELKAF